LAVVLSVLLQYMDFDYPFGIFKLFLWGFVHNRFQKICRRRISYAQCVLPFHKMGVQIFKLFW